MASAREVKLRIRSVKNIAQVTRALQAVSASRVRKAMEKMFNTRPYATKAWQVLTHIAGQPDRAVLHPLLTEREEVKNVIVVMLSSDRGLAGAYNTNILRYTLDKFGDYSLPVRFITVGRKGNELLFRRGKDIMAEFADLPAEPDFNDVSAIGRLAVDEFLSGKADEVYLLYTDFVNMGRQDPTMKKLLPLEFDSEGLVQAEFGQDGSAQAGPNASYIYEPGQEQILDEIIPRFTALQIYQAVLESSASEHAARMVAMRSATENATDLAGALQLEYNKVRQQGITNEMLDIAGGAEALSQAKS
ncbi:MAG: ATP synthase F1 subunit gamma [Chloroflexi bacterium]|nr:MAG: ATP synthase F1 subunit gamma [Chloroflexota bacterium]MBL1194443.1 ATP synthase F1 subunit gamma [Chloroflexota bacterium]NOH11731.1 ATP synthase F1 subunit gamma [Chloroflexota bacterium]